MNGIDEDLWRSIKNRSYHAYIAQIVGTAVENDIMDILKVKREANDKRCMGVLRGAFPPVFYSYVRGCNTN